MRNKMKIIAVSLVMLLGIHICATSIPAVAASIDASGKTLLLIGQTYQDEFEDYINGIGTAPAGSSHYGEIYSGTINQGDDGKNFDDSAPYLDWVGRQYPNATALIAISIKDNPMAGGYGNLDTDPSCIYKATKDIAYTTKWDDNIRKFADKFKQYPNITFLVRIGYEVNLLMMANASGMNFLQVLDKYNAQGINIFEDISLADPADIDVKAYHDAYNKIARMIREEEGASNVKFVYHPVRGFGEVKALYPGDEYVDYIAFSTFNHDLSIGTDEDNEFVRRIGYDGSRLDSNLRQSLDWASVRKPIIIGEAAYQKAPPEWAAAAGSKHSNVFLEYLDRLFEVIEAYDIKALTYINSNWIAHNWPHHWGDSRVEAFPDVKEYWMNNVVRNARYVQYGGTVISDKPSPLTGLKAVAGDKEVTLSWNASHGATSYDIAYEGKTLTTASTAKTITNLTNDKAYTFTVTPKNHKGSGTSSSVSAVPKPAAQGGLTGSYANGETKEKEVALVQAGMYRLDVKGDTGVVSQLISAKLGTVEGGLAAVNSGTISSIYFHNVQSGTMKLAITSMSDSVALSEVKLWAPNGSEIGL